jgi:hypothetical protein
MIGRKLPNATLSRCIVIELSRREADERVVRFTQQCNNCHRDGGPGGSLVASDSLRHLIERRSGAPSACSAAGLPKRRPVSALPASISRRPNLEVRGVTSADRGRITASVNSGSSRRRQDRHRIVCRWRARLIAISPRAISERLPIRCFPITPSNNPTHEAMPPTLRDRDTSTPALAVFSPSVTCSAALPRLMLAGDR